MKSVMWVFWDLLSAFLGTRSEGIGLSSMQQGVGILVLILLLAPILSLLYPAPPPRQRVIVKRVILDTPSYGTYNPAVGHGKDV